MSTKTVSGGRKLRVGVIGLGVGESHIPGFERHPNAEVVAVCDLNPEKLAKAAAERPGLAVTNNADDILRDPGIDVVSIASFDNFHHAQVLSAFQHGKHVFAEKPLCLTFAELADIRTAWKASKGLRLSSNLILRKSPRFAALRKRIQTGEFGRVYCVEGSYDYGRLHKLHQGWRGEIPHYSVTLGGGLHVLDLILWLTGDHVREVFAYGTRLASEGSIFQHDDTVAAVVKLESGAVAKVTANFACVHPHFHELNLHGTKRSFFNGLDAGRVFHSGDAKVAPELMNEAYPGVHKGDLIPGFVDTILGGAAPEISEEEIFHGMAACLSIDDSVKRGTPVRIAEMMK